MGCRINFIGMAAIVSALAAPLAAQPALQVGSPPPAAAAVAKPPITMTTKPMKTLQLLSLIHI